MTTVLVATGPDLGRRDPRIVGSSTGRAASSASDLRRSVTGVPGVDVEVLQTDDEAELISWLHRAVERGWGVVLDPEAFTHYSYALRDAAALVTDSGLPLIEVHLTNPASRDDFRAVSVISAVATGAITGLGLDSYALAVRAAADRVVAREVSIERPF